MSIEGWKEIVAVPRHTVRRMRTTIRGSPVKALTEIITNCDDSYYRLEQAGLKTSGLIQVGYWKKMERGLVTVKAFCVRDYAEGISHETMGEKFGRYGADTSGNTRRGYFGQGAKDALCTMKNSVILTVNDGYVTYCKFKLENDVPQYFIADEAEALAAMKGFNERISNIRELNVNENGTLVYFEVPLDQHSPRVKGLSESLESFHMLWKILSDPDRKVELIDCDTGETFDLRYKSPSGKLMEKDSLKLAFNALSFDVDLTVCAAEHELNQEPGEKREGGLLVVDENHAVLDLNLFGFDYESSAACLFGEVQIAGFKTLFRKDGTVILESREGLDFNHPFNKLLRQRIHDRLSKVVDRLEFERPLTGVKVDERLDKRFKLAFARINTLMRKETELSFGEGEVEAIPRIPENGIMFSVAEMKIESGQTRTVRLVVDLSKVPAGSIIALKTDNPHIHLEPSDSAEIPADINVENPLRLPILIMGEQPGTQATVTASFQKITAHLIVNVITESPLFAPSGFDFVPNKVWVYEGRRVRLRLLVDIGVISPGNLVACESDNLNIKVVGEGEPLEIPRPQTGKVSMVSVEVEGVKSGQRGHVYARSSSREARAEVHVLEELMHGGFFKGYSLDFEKDARRRSSFDRESGIIYIHMSAPVLKNYFGDKGDKLIKERTPQALVMLAEVILNCICLQWAKYRFESGVREYLNPDDASAMREEEESEARLIDYEFGKMFHNWLLSGFEINHMEQIA